MIQPPPKNAEAVAGVMAAHRDCMKVLAGLVNDAGTGDDPRVVETVDSLFGALVETTRLMGMLAHYAGVLEEYQAKLKRLMDKAQIEILIRDTQQDE